MRNAVIGLVVGVVVGVVVGTTLVAPRLGGQDPVTAVRELAERSAKDRQAEQERAAVVSAPAVRWQLASVYAEGLPLLGNLAKRMEMALAEVSGGDVAIEFHGPGELVDVSATLEAVSRGDVEAAFASPARWEEQEPALAVFAGLPFGPSPRELLAWIEHGGGRAIHDEIYAERGVKALPCGLTAGAAAGWFRQPVRRVEDFAGLRIRASGLAARVLETLGAEPQELTPGRILSAFERGEIDAAMFSTPAVDSALGLQEMVKHYHFPGWHRPAQMFELIVGTEAWETISPMARAQIEAVCGDNLRLSLAESEAVQYEALKKLTDAGVDVSRWPSAVVGRLRTAWMEVANETATKDPTFAKAWNSLQSFRRDYTVWRNLSKL